VSFSVTGIASGSISLMDDSPWLKVIKQQWEIIRLEVCLNL
jgi:hypothetical protein